MSFCWIISQLRSVLSYLVARPAWSAPDQLYWRREVWLFCGRIVDWKGSGGCHRPCWNFSCHLSSRQSHRPVGRTSSEYSQPEGEKYSYLRAMFLMKESPTDISLLGWSMKHSSTSSSSILTLIDFSPYSSSNHHGRKYWELICFYATILLSPPLFGWQLPIQLT